MLRSLPQLRCGTISRLLRPSLAASAEQAWPTQQRQFAALPLRDDSASIDEFNDATKHWFRDEGVTAKEGAKIVRQRMETIGAQKIQHILEVAKRVETPADAATVLDLAQQFTARRANRQQHDGISPQATYLILKKAFRGGKMSEFKPCLVQGITTGITRVSVDTAVEVLRKGPELQMTFTLKPFRHIIVQASKAGNLAIVNSAFKLLTAAGLRPNADLAYTILRACFDNKRPDLAIGYAREFVANNVWLRPYMKRKVQQAEEELQQRRAAAKEQRAAEAVAQKGAEPAEAALEEEGGESEADDESKVEESEAGTQPAEKQLQ